jgi:hypothetical protein
MIWVRLQRPRDSRLVLSTVSPCRSSQNKNKSQFSQALTVLLDLLIILRDWLVSRRLVDRGIDFEAGGENDRGIVGQIPDGSVTPVSRRVVLGRRSREVGAKDNVDVGHVPMVRVVSPVDIALVVQRPELGGVMVLGVICTDGKVSQWENVFAAFGAKLLDDLAAVLEVEFALSCSLSDHARRQTRDKRTNYDELVSFVMLIGRVLDKLN